MARKRPAMAIAGEPPVALGSGDRRGGPPASGSSRTPAAGVATPTSLERPSYDSDEAAESESASMSPISPMSRAEMRDPPAPKDGRRMGPPPPSPVRYPNAHTGSGQAERPPGGGAEAKNRGSGGPLPKVEMPHPTANPKGLPAVAKAGPGPPTELGDGAAAVLARAKATIDVAKAGETPTSTTSPTTMRRPTTGTVAAREDPVGREPIPTAPSSSSEPKSGPWLPPTMGPFGPVWTPFHGPPPPGGAAGVSTAGTDSGVTSTVHVGKSSAMVPLGVSSGSVVPAPKKAPAPLVGSVLLAVRPAPDSPETQ